MTHFKHWKQWIERIFRTHHPRARRGPKGDRRADLTIAVESFESRELLSANAILGAFAHFGSAGAGGHDLVAGGPAANEAFDGQFSFNRDGGQGWRGDNSQSTNGTHLVFTVEPTNGTAGQSFSVTVSVEDSSGNVVTGNDSNLTLRVADGPGEFSDSRTLSATAVNGVATFNNVVLNTAGTYTLAVSSRGAGRVFSNSITIAPDTTDSGTLVFESGTGNRSYSNNGNCDGSHFGHGFWSHRGSGRTSSASISGTAGQPLSTFRVVEEDKFGNVITSDNTSTITIAVNTGSSSALDSKSTLTATVVDGVATFNNVILDTAGQYTLSATDSNSLYPVAISSPITVSAETTT